MNLRFACRQLRINPGFTTVAVIILGLGIGANTALFSFIHGVLLRPLPYPDPDRIVVLCTTWVDQPASLGQFPDRTSLTGEAGVLCLKLLLHIR